MDEPRADVRRRDIVATAAQLFETEGFATTSMERIARAVGLAKPSLYHYFASKDDILFAIHEEFINLLVERQEQRAVARLSPPQELLEVFGDVFDLMDTHRGHVRVFFEHYRELPITQQEVIKAKRDAYERSVEAVIVAGNETGELRGVDPRLVTLALFGMSNWAYQWFRSGGPLTARQVAVQFWDYLMRGIGTEPLPGS
ncbi:MAG: TetR/AcrR family transcriptional regulator [Actinomycetota bacterium]|nr:TetR/AcrR family transcriptional regulator [Actinomycetota bacterium]